MYVRQSPSSPRENQLLDMLPSDAWQRLVPHPELVRLRLGDVFYEFLGKLSHAYFPTFSRVSLLYVLEDGASEEIAVAGSYGMLGVVFFIGGETMPNRAVVQSEGYSYRMRSQLLLN
jgi:hypothetical protein